MPSDKYPREYTPDAWVILRISVDGEVIEKVLGGWYGGFLGTNSWRLNSGITRIERDGDWYVIHGSSSSVYRVHKEAQRMTMLMGSIFQQLIDRAKDKGGTVERIDVSEAQGFVR